MKNRFVVNIPLFVYSAGEKVVPLKSGVNWGNQYGNSRASGPIESYLAIKSEMIDNYPAIFSPNQINRINDVGKSTRVNDPVMIIWDDGTKMMSVFSGTGVVRDGRTFPKQLTSNDGGGAILGGYLRKRLNVNERHIITYSDLERYGRDYVTLTYIQDGIFTADFSV